MTYLIAFLNKINAIVKNIIRIPHDAIAGEKLDFKTKTPNILSKKINRSNLLKNKELYLCQIIIYRDIRDLNLFYCADLICLFKCPFVVA